MTREELAGSYVEIPLHVQLADISDADVMTNLVPWFNGTVERLIVIVSTPVTTADDLSTVTVQIGSTAVTGTATEMTSANMATLGVVKNNAATGAPANKAFTTNDTLSLVASSTTAFAEGSATFILVCRRAM